MKLAGCSGNAYSEFALENGEKNEKTAGNGHLQIIVFGENAFSLAVYALVVCGVVREIGRMRASAEEEDNDKREMARKMYMRIAKTRGSTKMYSDVSS